MLQTVPAFAGPQLGLVISWRSRRPRSGCSVPSATTGARWGRGLNLLADTTLVCSPHLTLLWLQVPFTLHDEDISEDWECADNIWDRAYASCSVPQALSDNEIDAILAKQVLAEQPQRPVHDCTPQVQVCQSQQHPPRAETELFQPTHSRTG